jgi:hypothetical protein
MITIRSNSALFFKLLKIKQIVYHLNHHLYLQTNTEKYIVDQEIMRKYDNL